MVTEKFGVSDITFFWLHPLPLCHVSSIILLAPLFYFMSAYFLNDP